MSLRVIKPSQLADKKVLQIVAEEVFKYLGYDFEVNLNFVSNKKMKELNKIFLDKEKATNVLSFNHEASEKDGDIAISEEIVITEAKKLGYLPLDFLKLYLVHGMLHLAGFDHQNVSERVRMEKAEEKILNNLNVNIER